MIRPTIRGMNTDMESNVGSNTKPGQISTDNSPKRMVKRAAGRARKAGSGARRLDDLMGGGFPLRSVSVVHGPAFIGKDVLLSQFIAEGIKNGIPSVIVLTHSTPRSSERG